MAYTIRGVNYFYAMVEDQPGEGYKLLSLLAKAGVNLLAFTAVPIGPMRTQLALFPEDAMMMADVAKKATLELDGPHSALLVQGDDELGALAQIHERLYKDNVNIYASTGVTDGKGSVSYVLYIRPEEYERAMSALEL